MIVLVLAFFVAFVRFGDSVIVNLCYLDSGVYPHRLNTEQFQRPIPRESDITESSSDVYADSESADRRAAFKHWDITFGFGVLCSAAKIELPGREHKAFLRNVELLCGVIVAHVEGVVRVDEQLIMQREVVAVGVEPVSVERVYYDFAAYVILNLKS